MMARKYVLLLVWLVLIVFLAVISLNYRSRTEAMVAVVESQITSISYQKPVLIERIQVVPGQEVEKGDTLLVVSRPDLSLNIDRKTNELERLQSQIIQSEQEYRSRKALIEIESEGKINRLGLDLAELETRLGQQKSVSKKLNAFVENGTGSSYVDSLALLKIRSINQEIESVKNYQSKEVQRLYIRSEDERDLIQREISLVERELLSLKNEYISLIRVAGFDGIIGTLGVQLDELVPPYKAVLSIYEKRPTLIKAYMNESISYPINPGDDVSVVSENRLYSIEGKVIELGARITDFPEKLQTTHGIKNYGQEVFINISRNNKFLNGEKVFVYPKGFE
ncbi:MAG: hypothetical protein JXR03_13050 [Cyclobacteriaceae bacterium]